MISTSSNPKNSIVIQQLCKHITILQQLNAKLHEKIMHVDFQKEMVCRALSKNSWQDLLGSLSLSINLNHQFNNTVNSPGFCSKINSASKNNKQNQYFQFLQDTSCSCEQRNKDGKYKEKVERTPLQVKKINYQSAFQSPIQSESRLINRSIRGDTDRGNIENGLFQQIPEVRKYQNIVHSKQNNDNQEQFTMRGKNNEKNKTFLLTLNNIAFHSQSQQLFDLKSSEEQNMLLSIQNTKLRNRVVKLQALLSSRSYQ